MMFKNTCLSTDNKQRPMCVRAKHWIRTKEKGCCLRHSESTKFMSVMKVAGNLVGSWRNQNIVCFLGLKPRQPLSKWQSEWNTLWNTDGKESFLPEITGVRSESLWSLQTTIWSLIPVLEQPIHSFMYWTIDPSIQKENKTCNPYSTHSN